MTNLFTSHTVLFAGYSLSDPDLLLFLEQLQFAMRDKMRPHYALMRTKGMNPYKRRSFETQYGVRILGDDALDGYPAHSAYAPAPYQLTPVTGCCSNPLSGEKRRPRC